VLVSHRLPGMRKSWAPTGQTLKLSNFDFELLSPLPAHPPVPAPWHYLVDASFVIRHGLSLLSLQLRNAGAVAIFIGNLPRTAVTSSVESTFA